MSEVLAHQPFDALPRLRPRAIQGLRGVLLELVGQHVVVPFPLQMQDGPDAQQKVLGLVQTCRVGRTVSEQGGIGEPRDRAHRQHVAQRPGCVLRVRLELIRRAVESGVPFVDQPLQLLQNRRVRLGAMERRQEVTVHGRIAHHPPRVEQCQEKLGIAGFEGSEIGELAYLMSDDEVQVPERMQKGAEKPLLVGADRPLEQHEEIDVGMKRQVAASVAAERQHRHRPFGRGRFEKQALQQRVDPIRVPLGRDPAGGPTDSVLHELLARRLEHRCRAGGGTASVRVHAPSSHSNPA